MTKFDDYLGSRGKKGPPDSFMAEHSVLQLRTTSIRLRTVGSSSHPSTALEVGRKVDQRRDRRAEGGSSAPGAVVAVDADGKTARTRGHSTVQIRHHFFGDTNPAHRPRDPARRRVSGPCRPGLSCDGRTFRRPPAGNLPHDRWNPIILPDGLLTYL